MSCECSIAYFLENAIWFDLLENYLCFFLNVFTTILYRAEQSKIFTE